MATSDSTAKMALCQRQSSVGTAKVMATSTAAASPQKRKKKETVSTSIRKKIPVRMSQFQKGGSKGMGFSFSQTGGAIAGRARR